MKQKYIGSLFILLITCLFTSCNENTTDDTPNGLSITLDLADNQISGNGGPFTLRIKTTGKWTATVNESWCKLYKNEGDGSSSIVGVTASNGNSERTAIISVTSNGETQTLTITQSAKSGGSTDPNPNPNPNPDPDPTPDPDPDKPSGYAGRIEIPQLKGGNMNQFITHTTARNGKDYPTYSLEYSYKYKHAYWIAYRFDSSTGGSVGRNESYKPDPALPPQYAVNKDSYSGSGYTRGHLCASSDRQYSVEANRQTFYMSNISPQSGNGFNQSGSAWNTGEDKVQAWGYAISLPTDTLYVVKGGTLGEDMIKGYIPSGVAIPKYFFMAVLFRSGNTYKSIGFYMPHEDLKTDPDKKDPKKYLMSIDELENKTGLNFFHNLPISIENTVEATYDVNAWKW